MRISDWSSDVCSSDLLKSDPDFMDLSWRLHNNAAVTEVVSGWSRALPTAEAVARLRAGGVACAPINDIEDLKRWPHLRERGMLNEVERSEEHTSELQSLMRTSYAVFC